MNNQANTYGCISSFLEFHSWSFYFFLFFFVLFFCRPCFFSFPFFFLSFFDTPFPLSGEARRDWTRYGKQTALSGRYHSNCLTVWFAVGFLTVRFSHFCFSLLIWFLLFRLLFFLFFSFCVSQTTFKFYSLSFSFPSSLFLFF